MADQTSVILEATGGDQPYQARDLTYANSFPVWYKRAFIRTMENLTGRIKLLRLVRTWERDENRDPDFWKSVLDQMGIGLSTPQAEIDAIPKTGPLVIVSNHPHGLVDGIVMAHMISHVRDDYKILTRSLLCHVPRIEKYLLPVSFPHEENAARNNIKTRKLAIEHVKSGGCIALFPAGTVATAKTYFGEAVDPEWATFTAKMIRQTGAQVLPVYYPGQNSRVYQIANLLSVTLRQSLLLHEIKAGLNKDQGPRIGKLVPAEVLESYEKDAKGLMTFLRDQTYGVKGRI